MSFVSVVNDDIKIKCKCNYLLIYQLLILHEYQTTIYVPNDVDQSVYLAGP